VMKSWALPLVAMSLAARPGASTTDEDTGVTVTKWVS
jgi:hypothetical protein